MSSLAEGALIGDMMAFHNDPDLKRRFISAIDAQILAGTIDRRTFQNGHPVSVIRITVGDLDYSKYPRDLGIPQWAARLEEFLFDEVSYSRSCVYPRQFLDSIPVGFSAWDKLRCTFIVQCLERSLDVLSSFSFDKGKFNFLELHIDKAISSVRDVIEAHTEGYDAVTAIKAAARIRSSTNGVIKKIASMVSIKTATDEQWYAAMTAKAAARCADMAAFGAENSLVNPGASEFDRSYEDAPFRAAAGRIRAVTNIEDFCDKRAVEESNMCADELIRLFSERVD